MYIVEGSFTGLHGTEIEVFRRVLQGTGGIGVEIGCCDGYSTVNILAVSDLHLTSIDPFIVDPVAPCLQGKLERFQTNLKPFGERITLLQDYSWNVVKTWKTPLDFLFIDGDHRYESVLRDFNEWTPLIKTGGILAMHDSRMGRAGGATFHPGPTRVAREQVYDQPHRWAIIGEAFSLTVARKIT
jgi:predicted O-methyltransferase YrrM